ncbi:B- and T-lymphocyte attenuator isoform X3 [Hippopotamus amphibius kiboko]|uniref:B- and T-lymphocyte attenuator isoform X3 n=1 Tax=Hippopotamus amphibius kiboko TaxID=575201 RepID=UPI0025950535|nr:B- and T-lymphocyte attenuator isoform X3 [Hippopotamus amphibius kiboko]
MKTLPAKLGMGIFLGILFLIPFAGIWSINGDELCDVQLYIKRYSIYVVPSGDPFELECPVKYCANRPTVTWCKLEGNSCLHLGDRLHGYMAWEERKNIPVFILHFNQVLASDSGSYRCSVNSTSGLIESHSVTINVTEWTQNNSEHPLIREEMKLSDTTGREINLVDVPQPFRNEDTEVSTRQNSQILPSGTGIYDNDPWFRVQRKSGVYFNPCLEENKQGIVYASLNHSIIGMNPRQARNVQEAHTEYAAICVRS